MQYSVAKKISTQECYNNEFQVISLHSDFADAVEASGKHAVIEVGNSVSVGDSINDNGKPWGSSHGNTGNKNAFKGVELDSIIRCRVNSHDKAGWVKTAADHGLNLSEWVVQTLNEQSDYK